MPRCPAVVRTEGTGIEAPFFMVYEADGEVRTATSEDGLEGDWSYGDQRLAEYKSNMGVVVVPAGIIQEC